MATAVVKSMGRGQSLDAVQPMRYGWYIYMHTQADRNTQVQHRIVIAGKHITLRSDIHSSQRATVKITLTDLPLHSVSNEDVLDAVKVHCPVQSEVHYANLWFEGKLTSVRNGDRYFYIAQSDLPKLPSDFHILEHKAHIFKPLAIMTCKRCRQQGH